ncbi:thiamine phosphate synthase [Cytobacillus purgationiresistens]|uniref:Thiazole tautomerase (Transcriptional regulator TenI) n=1 Tax=Cytobacillus purgationiresistens TaxID=863449 RepID=A0ABU0AAG2_9BACI|nr:thiamine phosphate synthase [Cytobacillus purgationiresistens]MDQ0268232.1 thiazole tautomerase (transcriptional regulator TenI) [Cytobacillus purgationiresistens]
MAKQLHLISDGKLSLAAFADIAGRVVSFVDFIHLREKEVSSLELYHGVQLLLNKGVPSQKIIINDRVDVASVFGTGIQLAFHSLPTFIVKKYYPDILVGRSIHSVEEAIEAEKQGADLVIYGHVYMTSSKKDLPPKGITNIAIIKKKTDIPLIAIGGITPDNVSEVLNMGADGIAVMSGILHAENPFQAAECYAKKLIQGGKAYE